MHKLPVVEASCSSTDAAVIESGPYAKSAARASGLPGHEPAVTVRPSKIRETRVYKPFDLSGKVALVTGGNGGIGLGMAEALAAAGADVVIWGTNETKNAAAEKTLKAHGKRVAVRKVDVSKENEVVDGMKAALADMGRTDFVEVGR